MGIGIPLMVVGLVLLVGGAAAVAYSELDQADNEEQVFSDDDEDRADRNEQLRTGGFVVGVVGAVLAIVGVGLVASRR